MLTNTLFKKVATACMLLAMCSMFFMTIGCSEDKDNPVANSQDEMVTITTPDGEVLEISQAEIEKFTSQSKMYEAMIDAMDPYVSQNGDGTFVLDYEAFLSSQGQSLTAEEMEIAQNFNSGISVVNQKIQEAAQSGTAAKIWRTYRWWGYQDCFSELSAINMLEVIKMVMPPLWFWANYYYYHYSYFCICHPWAGGIWISS